MKKTYIVAVGLLFSVSANAQLLDVFKSAVKNQTGVDLSKVGQKKYNYQHYLDTTGHCRP